MKLLLYLLIYIKKIKNKYIELRNKNLPIFNFKQYYFSIMSTISQ